MAVFPAAQSAWGTPLNFRFLVLVFPFWVHIYQDSVILSHQPLSYLLDLRTDKNVQVCIIQQ